MIYNQLKVGSPFLNNAFIEIAFSRSDAAAEVCDVVF